MVAYSFKARFVDPIVAGTKVQTLRNDRKRHARVGETLQLYTGMRTKHCRLIGTATCVAVTPIRLVFFGGWIEYPERPGVYVTQLDQLTAFCRADGFAHWNDLAAFWREHHPEVGEAWSGILIEWGNTFEAPDRELAIHIEPFTSFNPAKDI